MEEINVGIEFGATSAQIGFTCIDDDLKIFGSTTLFGEDYRSRLPSYITFNYDILDRVVGTLAFQTLTAHPRNTIYDMKNLIGLKYEDCKVFENKYPFKFVKSDTNNKAMIETTFNETKCKFYIEELYSMILKELINNVESKIKKKIKGAVIAIPNKYTNSQRNAVLEAAKMINLDVIQMVHETTAIAIDLTRNRNKKNILIVDFGGGKLELCLARLNNSNVEILISDGISNFGGNDFTNALVKYCVELFKNQCKQIINEDNYEALSYIFKQCEKAKHDLFKNFKVHIDLSSIGPLKLDLNREMAYNNICKHLFQRMEDFFVEMNDVILRHKYKIDEIFLSGGGSHMFNFQHMVEKIFVGTNYSIDIRYTDDAIARGARLLASTASLNIPRVRFTEIISKDIRISSIPDPNQNEPFIHRYSKMNSTYNYNFKKTALYKKTESICDAMTSIDMLANENNASFNACMSLLNELALKSSKENEKIIEKKAEQSLNVNINCHVNIINTNPTLIESSQQNMLLLYVFECDNAKYDLIGIIKVRPDIGQFDLSYDQNGMLKLQKEIIFEHSVHRFNAQELYELQSKQREIDDIVIEKEAMRSEFSDIRRLVNKVLNVIEDPKVELLLKDSIKETKEYFISIMNNVLEKLKRKIPILEKTKQKAGAITMLVKNHGIDNTNLLRLFKELKQCRAVAVDFGTMFSRVAVYIEVQTHMIEISKDTTETPNYVYIDKNEKYVYGEDALKLCNNYSNLLYNLKRKLLNNRMNKDDFIRYVGPMFKIFKEMSEKYLGIDPNLNMETLYVFTVPIEFPDYVDTIRSCIEYANITRYFLMDDAHAIALNYTIFEKNKDSGAYVLIVDIGAGKCGLTLYERYIKNMKRISAIYDLKVCGEEFTSILVDYCKSQIDQNLGLKFESDEYDEALFRLRNECETAKIKLSSEEKTEIIVEHFFGNYNFKIEITREKFESLCSNLFEKFYALLNYWKTSIDKVFITGGSSKIPKIKELISSYFENAVQIIENDTNFVVKGASFYAAWKNGESVKYLEDIDSTKINLDFKSLYK